MTIQDVTNFVDYVGNASQTSFAFVFKVEDAAWVSVDFTDQLSSINLNINQDVSPGGTVEYSVAPPDAQSIHIQRVTPVTQETDYGRHDPFDSETNEDNLDKLTSMIQDLRAGFENLVISVDTGFKWEFVLFAGNRILGITDAYKMLQSTDTGGTQLVTVPPHTDVGFDVGTQISFEQKGTAVLEFVGGAGVNIDTPSLLAVSVRYGTVTLIQDEINNWVLLGNIAQS
jgi:hypothetical protein